MTTSEAPVETLDAATVILVREPYEVLLMLRDKHQAFLGGACVFPGGMLEAQDRDPRLLTYTGEQTGDTSACRLNEQSLPEETARGLFFAAIRETFEEAGILLARTASGDGLSLSDPETSARFAAHRLAVYSHARSLADLAAQEGLTYLLEDLVPYSHWITPVTEPRRYDTRFFLARLPRRQCASPDNTELAESFWISPWEALRMHYSGRIMLIPPTLKTMEELAEFSLPEALFEAVAQGEPYPILGEFFHEETLLGLRLPHDPAYANASLRRPFKREEPSRIILSDGIWRTAFADDEGRTLSGEE